MSWNYQSNFVYKYKGSLNDLKISFFNAIQSYNQEYPNDSFKVAGDINEDYIQLELERSNKIEVDFYSPIQLVNGEIRIEGIIKTIVKRPLIISIFRFLFKIILSPFIFIFWILKKRLRGSNKLSKYKKLTKIMIDYIGCEPGLLIETETQLEAIKHYLMNSENFTGIIDVKSDSGLLVRFNEYLELDIILQNQYDEAYVSINNDLTHWHPMNIEVLDQIKDIVEGKIFFIEYRNIFKISYQIKVISSNLELKKYIGKKHIRIYNNQIIQRSKN